MYECEFVPDRNTAYWRLWTRNKSPIDEQKNKNNNNYNTGGKKRNKKQTHKNNRRAREKEIKNGLLGEWPLLFLKLFHFRLVGNDTEHREGHIVAVEPMEPVQDSLLEETTLKGED